MNHRELRNLLKNNYFNTLTMSLQKPYVRITPKVTNILNMVGKQIIKSIINKKVIIQIQ